MIRFHITKPAQEFYFSDTGPEPQIAFSFPDHFLKIGVLDGPTSPSPLAQIRKSEFLIGPFTLYCFWSLAMRMKAELELLHCMRDATDGLYTSSRSRMIFQPIRPSGSGSGTCSTGPAELACAVERGQISCPGSKEREREREELAR